LLVVYPVSMSKQVLMCRAGESGLKGEGREGVGRSCGAAGTGRRRLLAGIVEREVTSTVT